MPRKKNSKSATIISKSKNEPSVPWWMDAVIYQIYPRSYQDSNGDGIGDLGGIIQRLDYLSDVLCIDAIWLSPIYPSPMVDFGYDISDYEGIDPIFGDMYTFKVLLKEAHKRNIKIIMDLVVNHTSNLHPWFLESRSSKENPKRDWYIWKEGKNGKVPNNWMAAFGGKGWEWDSNTEEFYFHGFTIEQPDLNWRNPEVKKNIFKMIAYWLDLGVDGFRLDVVNYYFKDDKFRDNPRNFFSGIREYEKQEHIYDRNRPETHELLKDFRKLLDSYEGDRMSVGEVYMHPPGNAELPASFYGKDEEELHMAFNFSFLYCKWNPSHFKNVVQDWEKNLKNHHWPNYTLSNHDQKRHFSRYAKSNESIPRSKIAATMLLTLRGTPFLYYGEEIGMESDSIPRKFIQDPLGKRYWPVYPGRDNCRQPMCWNLEKYFGFSSTVPWLPISKKGSTNNVEVQLKDENSILNTYRKLLTIRKKEIALRRGSQRLLFLGNEKVFSFLRIYEGERILVLLNFVNDETRFFSNNEITSADRGKILFSTHRKSDSYYDLNIISLLPLEGLVVKLDN